MDRKQWMPRAMSDDALPLLLGDDGNVGMRPADEVGEAMFKSRELGGAATLGPGSCRVDDSR